MVVVLRSLVVLALGVVGVFAHAHAAAAEDAPASSQTAEWHGLGTSPEGKHLPLGVHWDEGLWLIREPKGFSLKVNFRMDLDYVGVNDDKYVAAGGLIGNTDSGLNDGNVRGGEMFNATLGLNWHLAERRRLMFNFSRAQLNDGIANEPIWIFQTRLQLEL